MRFFDKKDLVIAFLLGCLLFASFGWTVSHDWSQVKNVNITGGQLSQNVSFSLVPSGAIMPFDLDECPSGWKFADGTEDTPDLRGLFIRASGTSAVLRSANGTNFTAARDQYYNDTFQGHWHELYASSGVGSFTSLTGAVSSQTSVLAVDSGYYRAIENPKEDGVNGVPRTGYETAPVSWATIYCIKE